MDPLSCSVSAGKFIISMRDPYERVLSLSKLSNLKSVNVT